MPALWRTGDRIGEEVRPLLLDETGAAAFGARRLIDRPGLGPRLDLADDDAVADHHLEIVDRAVVGQREDVNGLDPAVAGVAEHLGDPATHGRPAHRKIDVRAEPHGFGEARAVGIADEEAARLHGARRHGLAAAVAGPGMAENEKAAEKRQQAGHDVPCDTLEPGGEDGGDDGSGNG